MAAGGVISGATKGRGGPALARHLADRRRKPQNDATRLGATRGIMADSIEGAIAELTHIVSHARSRQPLYHVHLDPEQPWTQTQCDRYWFLFEQEFGFEKQPFAEAVHIKHGREHYHRAYSRLRRDGTVIAISHDFARREKVGRLAEFEFGGRHVPGRHNKAVAAVLRRDGRMDVLKSIEAAGLTSMPRPEADMTPGQRHQAARTGLDPVDVAMVAFRVWQQSPTDDLAQQFALEGLRLCQGDKGPVLVDLAGGVHSLTRVIGKASAATGHRIRAADVKARIADIDLPLLSNEGGHYYDRTDPAENVSDLDAQTDALPAQRRAQSRTPEYPRSAGEVYRPKGAEPDRRGDAAHIRELGEAQGPARAAPHPQAGGTQQSRKNPRASGGRGAIQCADCQRAGQSRRAAGRNRIADRRVEWIFGEQEFQQPIDRIVAWTARLDPGSAMRQRAEEARVERMLDEPEFSPAISAIEALALWLVRLLAWLFEVLFGSDDPTVWQDAVVEPAPMAATEPDLPAPR